MTPLRHLVLWLIACGLVVLCSADLADKVHTSANKQTPTDIARLR